MTHELQFMFEFQSVINDMQGKIIEARMNGASEKQIADSIKRVDKLIEIYKNMDKYYYQAHFATQKILKLEEDNLSLAKMVSDLRTEKENLIKAAEWK